MSSAPSTPSKRMETNHEEDYKHQNACGEGGVVLGSEDLGKHDGGSVVNNGFFNETLDLSQEDIQRTLSANMPMCSSELERHPRCDTAVENRRRDKSNGTC